MDNAAIKDEGQEGELISGIFPLHRSPVDVQITVHVNNLLNTYGVYTTKEFKRFLNDPSMLGDYHFGSLVIQQIIRYYGVNKMRQWFELVYGWKFEKAG